MPQNFANSRREAAKTEEKSRRFDDSAVGDRGIAPACTNAARPNAMAGRLHCTLTMGPSVEREALFRSATKTRSRFPSNVRLKHYILFRPGAMADLQRSRHSLAMDYTGCCNERLKARYEKAAPAVHALAIAAGHAVALGLLLIPMLVPMLFKAWVGHEGLSAQASVIAAASQPGYTGKRKRASP